jgi:hypothetical protein
MLKGHHNPSLVILPSAIRIAGYGLYLHGAVESGGTVARYAGAVVADPANAESSGYQMQGPKDVVIDAKEERCLCSMANDAVGSSYANKCNFKRSLAVTMTSTRPIRDEEVFVCYGNSFELDLHETMMWVGRSFLTDFDRYASAALPAVQLPMHALHAELAAFDTRARKAARSERDQQRCTAAADVVSRRTSASMQQPVHLQRQRPSSQHGSNDDET